MLNQKIRIWKAGPLNWAMRCGSGWNSVTFTGCRTWDEAARRAAKHWADHVAAGR